MLAAAEREGDPGALACLRGNRDYAAGIDLAAFSKMLTRRATLTRMWQQFFDDYAVLLLPVSGELPFPDDAFRETIRRAGVGAEPSLRAWQAGCNAIREPIRAAVDAPSIEGEPPPLPRFPELEDASGGGVRVVNRYVVPCNWFQRYENDLDEARMAAWVKQAAALPGWGGSEA